MKLWISESSNPPRALKDFIICRSVEIGIILIQELKEVLTRVFVDLNLENWKALDSYCKEHKISIFYGVMGV